MNQCEKLNESKIDFSSCFDHSKIDFSCFSHLVICYTAASSGFGGDGVSEKTSNAIIAENGRVLKAYMFITWLYLFKKYNNCKI